MKNSEILSVGSLVIDEINGNKSIGGAATNVAVNINTLGGRSALLTGLSHESVSQEFVDYLAQLEIPVHSLSKLLSELPKCVIHIDKDGKEEGYDWYGNGIEELFQSSEIDNEFIRSFPQVYLAICETTYASRLAKSLYSEQILSFNPGSRVFESTAAFREVQMRANYIFLNEKEYGLTQEPQDLILRQDQVAVITRGNKDTWLITVKGIKQFTPEDITAVDETGAGDSFASAFTWARSQDIPLEKSVNLGNLLASFVVQQVGSHINKDTQQKFITEANKRDYLR